MQAVYMVTIAVEIKLINVNLLLISGTTWVQEMLYLIANEADILEASSHPLGQRVPCVEHTFPEKIPNVDSLRAHDGAASDVHFI